MNFNIGVDSKLKIESVINVDKIIMATLTKLLVIKIVANNLLGFFNNSFTVLYVLVSFFCFIFFGSMEKKATSDPEIKAEHIIRKLITSKLKNKLASIAV
jgi:hypothetical protein